MNSSVSIFAKLKQLDWFIIFPMIALTAISLLLLANFQGASSSVLFEKQVIWFCIAWGTFFILSFLDFRFLKNSYVVMFLYAFTIVLLASLFVIGTASGGALSWFSLGFAAFQPVELAKVVLIIVLAKYFSKRHVQIADFSHIFISGAYAAILFLLVLVQPDFGSAVIILCIWLGLVLVSGLNPKHLLGLLLLGIITLACMWQFVFADYQKQRIVTFLNPALDLRGAGYNSNQAKIALGSGGLWGKGIGEGSQSRLYFLPESETDFIFAAFAEEWGFFGILLLLLLYLLLIGRIIHQGLYGESNFEMLFSAGLAIYLAAHVLIHAGINMGLLPVTGTTIPFVSYGGSHLLAEFSALGILMGMKNYKRNVLRQESANELSGYGG